MYLRWTIHLFVWDLIFLALKSLCPVKAVSPRQTGMAGCPKLIIYSKYYSWNEEQSCSWHVMRERKMVFCCSKPLKCVCVCMNMHVCRGLPQHNLSNTLIKSFLYLEVRLNSFAEVCFKYEISIIVLSWWYSYKVYSSYICKKINIIFITVNYRCL